MAINNQMCPKNIPVETGTIATTHKPKMRDKHGLHSPTRAQRSELLPIYFDIQTLR
jgi:hypothetical protein